MNKRAKTASAGKLVDLGFIDARSKVLDIAAFLDRVDRHGGSDDFRVEALRSVLRELSAPEPGRARRILEALSDKSVEPAPSAPTQAACGAPPPSGLS